MDTIAFVFTSYVAVLTLIAVHKRGLQSGRLSGADIFQKRWRGNSSDADAALFEAKNFGFFEIYGVSALTRGKGLNQCGQGEEVNFSRFCATSFVDIPLRFVAKIGPSNSLHVLA